MLSALFAWLFSSVWVSREITQQANQTLDQLQRAESPYMWTLENKKAEIVSAYWEDWQQKPTAVMALKEKSVLSLMLKQRFSTQWFSALQLDARFNDAVKMNIEVTQGSGEVFFYAHHIAVKQGQHSYDLTRMRWERQEPGREWVATDWFEIGSIGSLVLQFYTQEGSNLIVEEVSMLQEKPIQLAAASTLDCGPEILSQELSSGVYTSVCLLSNAMVSLHSSINQDNPEAVLRIQHPLQPYLWILGLAACLFLMLALYSVSESALKKKRIWAVLLLILAFLWVIHRPEINVIHQWYAIASWIFIVVSVLVMFLIRYELHQAFMKQTYRGWFVVLIPTILIVVLMNSYASVDFNTVLKLLPLYLLWAFLQQILLGPVVSSFVQRDLSISPASAALLCGFLFSIVHMPNQILMLATWFGGSFWSWVWLRHGNLLPNVISHAVLALVFYEVVPEFYLQSARIGIRFVG
ncbi:lysostaphin resistance A-like protein [Marinicella sp. W31]|uniref:CPBP family intramembrane glutamic endopeptidase n=1 Tax=Marinicella sp. W31 TaxID=3023713 RepID=UPI0037578911